MEEQSFSANTKEWRCFDYGDAMSYPVLSVPRGDIP